METVRLVSVAEPEPALSRDLAPDRVASYHRLAAPLRRAIMRTRQWLLTEQNAEGYWVAELEGDSILQSEYILLLAFLGREQSRTAAQLANRLIETQLPGGGWAMYPGGKVEVGATVKAYFALKLTGHDPGQDYMQKARRAALAHGGADAVNSFTRFYLALLGQIPYSQCPAVPPELTLLPKWFPVNLWALSAWTRTIVVPLSIMSACKPVREVPPECGIRELFLKQPDDWPELQSPGTKSKPGLWSWDRFFRRVDRAIKWCERFRLLPLRRRALRAAERWMIDRFADSDGLGAIFPPMVWSVIALKCLGYDEDSSELRYCQEQLEGLMIRERSTARLEPCKSPVWDTANALRALCDSGASADEEAIDSAIDWLLTKEARRPGDWAKTVRAEPGGWYFEHANAYYPDVDDTAMVLMALADRFDSHPGGSNDDSTSRSLPPELTLVSQNDATDLKDAREQVGRVDRLAGAIGRGTAWMMAMQNRDGGWGAFDRNNDRQFLCHVPFADHNAMIDPSTADLTGRVLESLGRQGFRIGLGAMGSLPAVDESWHRRPAGEPQAGRLCHISTQAGRLCHKGGQAAHGTPFNLGYRKQIDRAVAYLRETQEADGSWFGRWGVNYIYGTWQVLVGLRQIGLGVDDPMMVAGANWLLAHQQPCGGWGESPDSYDNPRLRGQGPITASQTAWAVMGLIAAGRERTPAVARGVRSLLAGQNRDGSWDEPQFTGTGFPRVFYLRYHMYPIYFPLMALSRYAVTIGACLEEAETVASQLAEAAAAMTE
ncbi:MAG: squalene--hopene cyclase [Planctomycetes bacterium]|nr:squalene--hopene cyclase [Planctomycetota bacterium]